MCPPAPSLTPRERQIVLLVVAGRKRSAIAEELNLHVRTVDHHLFRLRCKVAAGSMVELAVWIVRREAA